MPMQYTPGSVNDLVSEYRTAKAEYTRFLNALLGDQEGLTHATENENDSRLLGLNVKESFNKFESVHKNAAEFIEAHPTLLISDPNLKALAKEVVKDKSTFEGARPTETASGRGPGVRY